MKEEITMLNRPLQILEAAYSILGDTIPAHMLGDTKDGQVWMGHKLGEGSVASPVSSEIIPVPWP